MIFAFLEGRKSQITMPIGNKKPSSFFKVGQKVFVREYFRILQKKEKRGNYFVIDYLAGSTDPDGKPFMNQAVMSERSARIFVEIVSITFKNFCDVTDEDAVKEGYKNKIEWWAYWRERTRTHRTMKAITSDWASCSLEVPMIIYTVKPTVIK